MTTLRSLGRDVQMKTDVNGVNRLHKKPNAQGLVEFALVAPVLLLVMFGIVDFGWMVFNYSQLNNGLRESVRYGSVNGFNNTQMTNCPGIRDAVLNTAGFAHLGNGSSTVHIWYDDGVPVEGPTSTTAFNNTILGTDSPKPPSVVAWCDSTWTIQYNTLGSTFAPPAGDPRADPAFGVSLLNNDRIVVDIQTDVPFLTPFIQAIAPSGLGMQMRSARTIYPQGV